MDLLQARGRRWHTQGHIFQSYGYTLYMLQDLVSGTGL